MRNLELEAWVPMYIYIYTHTYMGFSLMFYESRLRARDESVHEEEEGEEEVVRDRVRDNSSDSITNM